MWTQTEKMVVVGICGAGVFSFMLHVDIGTNTGHDREDDIKQGSY